MILFWLACLWLIASAFVFVFLPSRDVGRPGSGQTTTGANVRIYRDQLTELESELRDGRIEEERFLHDREELAQRMAIDLRTASTPGAKVEHAGDATTTLHWLGLMVSVAAILLYLAIGSPSSLRPAL